MILAVGSERPQAHLYAIDLSAEALEVASENAACCEQHVNWYCGDWFNALPEHNTPKFDVMVANPPYIGFT